GCPARDGVDELALEIFGQTLDPHKCTFEVLSASTLTSETLSRVTESRPLAICIGTLPSKELAHTLYLCNRLRAQCPGLKNLVRCWGLDADPSGLADRFKAVGANHVGRTFLDTRNQLLPLLSLRRTPAVA